MKTHLPPPAPPGPTPTAAPAPRAGKARVYQAPAIAWEQPFVALAQTSACPIPGESECVP